MPLLDYVTAEFFDHTGIPTDAPWFGGAQGHETLAKLRENLAPVARRIEKEWFGPSAKEPTDGMLDAWWTQEEHVIASMVQGTARDMGLPFVRKYPWPGGHSYAAVISHDVDYVHIATDFASNPLLAQVRAKLPEGPKRQIRRLIGVANLDASLGVPSSFYLHEQYEVLDEGSMASLLHTLLEKGFEVGLHASPVCRTDGNRLAGELMRLEELGHRRVRGIRVHQLAFDPAMTWGLEADAGLSYDSSFSWNRAHGFRAGSALPFHACNRKSGGRLSLIELPMAYMDWTDLHRGGDCERIVGTVESLLNRAIGLSGLLVLNFHNSYLDQRTHSEAYRAYLQTINLVKRTGAWLATGHQCASWWQLRCDAPVKLMAKSQTLIVNNPQGLPLLVWSPSHEFMELRTGQLIEVPIGTR